MKNIFKFFPFIIPAILFTTKTYAAGLVPCNPTLENPDACNNLCTMFSLGQTVLNYATTMAIALALVYVFIGGYKIMFSMGNPGNVTAGRKVIQQALLGVVIIFIAWMIVNTVIHFMNGETILQSPWNTVQC